MDRCEAGSLHGFPAALTSFVGRTAVVHEVAGQLAQDRLVTVTGPGGAGKTRLAGEVAGRVAARFADGVWLAELAAVRDPGQVAATVVRYRLGPLTLPDPGNVATAARCEAVMLFADRALRAEPGFALDEKTAAAVSRLVARLDGMPLAIELAAARVDTIGVTQLLDRIDDRFSLLADADRLAEERQRSLAGTVQWSYQLLDDAERRVFRAVSVFPGPFTLDAAEAVAGAQAGRAVLRLVDCSLVLPPQTGPDDRSRYGMLETLRAYGARLLAEAGEEDEVCAALAGYEAEMAGRALAEVYTRTRELDGLRQLDAEDATVRQVLSWALKHDPGTAVRLALMSTTTLARPRAPRAAFGQIVRNEARLAWRQPSGIIVSVGISLGLLIIFGELSVFRQSAAKLGGLSPFDVYIPILIAFAIGVIALAYLPGPLVSYREQGILRRLSGTPAPASWVLAAQLVVQACLMLISILLLLIVSIVFFGTNAPKNPGGLLLSVILAIAALFTIGLAIAAAAWTAAAARGIMAAAFYPLMFFAGLYYPVQLLPGVFQGISQLTPLGAAVQAMQAAMNVGFPPAAPLLVLAAYAVVFGYVAKRFFRWE